MFYIIRTTFRNLLFHLDVLDPNLGNAEIRWTHSHTHPRTGLVCYWLTDWLDLEIAKGPTYQHDAKPTIYTPEKWWRGWDLSVCEAAKIDSLSTFCAWTAPAVWPWPWTLLPRWRLEGHGLRSLTEIRLCLLMFSLWWDARIILTSRPKQSFHNLWQTTKYTVHICLHFPGFCPVIFYVW